MLKDIEIGTQIKISDGTIFRVVAKNHKTHPQNTVCLMNETPWKFGSGIFRYDKDTLYRGSEIDSNTYTFLSLRPESFQKKAIEVTIYNKRSDKNGGGEETNQRKCFIPAAGEVLPNFFPEVGLSVETFQYYLSLENQGFGGVKVWTRSAASDTGVFVINEDGKNATEVTISNTIGFGSIHAVVVSGDERCKAQPNGDGSFDLIE